MRHCIGYAVAEVPGFPNPKEELVSMEILAICSFAVIFISGILWATRPSAEPHH